MSKIQLFLESTQGAGTNEALDDAILSYAQEQGFTKIEELKWLPIGGSPEASWGKGQGWNNRFAIDAVSNPAGAFYEAVTNAVDTHIESAQRSGVIPASVTSPKDAMEILVQKNLSEIYVVTSKSGAAVASKKGGRPKKDRANVVTWDGGTGIAANAFGRTIMSIGGNNKITNAALAGSYGMGVKGILHFSPSIVIWSVTPEEPNVVSFTITRMMSLPGWKAPSYVWLCDEDGNALTIKRSQIPSKLLQDPVNIGADNAIESAKKVIVGKHGTAIKMFELEDFTSPLVMYNLLREMGFGMSVPVHFRSGIETSNDESTTKRRYDITGLRHSLNRRMTEKYAAYPVIWHEKPKAILNDQATLTLWVLKRNEKKKTKTHENLTDPIRSVVSKERWGSAIFVTLNGQTHRTLHTHTLLKKAGLPYLDGHMIMEIDCDSMDAETRRRYFVSNRENITREMDEQLKDDILEYLKERAKGDLGRIEAGIREAFISGANSADAMASAERLAQVMREPIAGAVFSKYGLPTNAGIGDNTGEKRERKEPDLEVLQAVPTRLGVLNRYIEPGKGAYISISTNAFDDFDNALTITKLPSFLSEQHRLALSDGRASYKVVCNEDAVLGTEEEVEVTLDRSSVNLPPLVDTATVIVGKAKARDTDNDKHRGNGQKSTLPKLNALAIDQHDPRWVMMDTIDTPAEDAAFNYRNAGDGSIDIFINRGFAPIKHVLDAANKKYADKRVVDRLWSDYEVAIQLLVLADLEANVEELGISPNGLHRIRAAAAKVQGVMMMIGMDSLDKSKPIASKRRAGSDDTYEEVVEISVNLSTPVQEIDA
jgi:hypothetical protein